MSIPPHARSGRVSPSIVRLLVLSTSWQLCGCASPPTADPPERRSLGADLPAYTAPRHLSSAPVEISVAAEPRGELLLRDALAAALLRNPELAAFSWEVRAREASALQAGLLPNPELSVELENVGGSGELEGAEQAETTLALGQLVELGGKRAKRRRVASLDAELAGWDYEARRVEICAEVVRAFASLLASQEELALASDLLELSRQSLDSLSRQVRAGAIPPVERTRAELRVASREIDRVRAEAGLATARRRLAALWGGREARFGVALGDLREVAPPPPLATLLERLDRSPELARREREVEHRQAVVSLEESRRIPDVTASAGVRRFEQSDDAALVFGVSVPFPIHDRNQGARLAARRSLAGSRHLERAAQVRVETEIRNAFDELDASFRELRALRDDALPRADAAQRDIQEGYRRGRFRLDDALDARRTLFELRAREIDALRRYHGAQADLERLTGTPLHPDPGDTEGDRP